MTALGRNGRSCATGRFMLIYAAMLAGVAFAFVAPADRFLPVDDQGFIIADVQTAAGRVVPRTLDVMKQVEDYLLKRPASTW